MMYRLRQYRTVYDDFEKGLSTRERAILKQRLRRVAEKGKDAGPKIVETYKGGVQVCKAQSGRKQMRLLFMYSGKKIIILEAYRKEKKIPPGILPRALERKKMIEENPEIADEIHRIN